MRIRFGTMSACRLLVRRTLLDIPGFHKHAEIVPGVSVARWSNQEADSKPKLLYVPGLESSGLNLYAHAEHLSHTFDVHSVVIDPSYKNDFHELSKSISDYVEATRLPHLLIGESFGAAVTLAVYQNLKRDSDLITALGLINSVTAFESSHWPDKMDEIINDWNLCRIVKIIAEHSPSGCEMVKLVCKLANSHGAHAEVHYAMLVNMSTMPSGLLQHRVMSWIGDAAIATKTGLLDNIKVPVLIIAGRRDLFLPSEQEAYRLNSLIPMGQIHLLDCGHMITEQLEPVIVPWFKMLKTLKTL